MKDLSFRAPPSLAIAENATTPTGALGAEIWSTTASKKLVWNGTAWVDAMGGGGSGGGDVTGPASSVAGNVAVFADTSGKVLADSGKTPLLGFSAVLTATQANSSSTNPTVLTGHSWTVPAGKSISLDSILVATSAATTTGICHGIRIEVPAGITSGAIRGAWFGYTNLSSAAAATGLADGESVNITSSMTVDYINVGTATTAGNNSSFLTCSFFNTSNVDIVVSVLFRTEVNASAVTAQIGTSAMGTIS